MKEGIISDSDFALHKRNALLRKDNSRMKTNFSRIQRLYSAL